MEGPGKKREEKREPKRGRIEENWFTEAGGGEAEKKSACTAVNNSGEGKEVGCK
jgi:hypothetical protein